MTQNIPAIDMVATGQRITDLRVAAGMSVRDLQDVFGFATPQALQEIEARKDFFQFPVESFYPIQYTE